MNTNKEGNKLPEPKIKKAIKSLNIRQKRISAIKPNVSFCDECGFRSRTANHNQGTHHKNAIRSAAK